MQEDNKSEFSVVISKELYNAISNSRDALRKNIKSLALDIQNNTSARLLRSIDQSEMDNQDILLPRDFRDIGDTATMFNCLNAIISTPDHDHEKCRKPYEVADAALTLLEQSKEVHKYPVFEFNQSPDGNPENDRTLKTLVERHKIELVNLVRQAIQHVKSQDTGYSASAAALTDRINIYLRSGISKSLDSF